MNAFPKPTDSYTNETGRSGGGTPTPALERNLYVGQVERPVARTMADSASASTAADRSASI